MFLLLLNRFRSSTRSSSYPPIATDIAPLSVVISRPRPAIRPIATVYHSAITENIIYHHSDSLTITNTPAIISASQKHRSPPHLDTTSSLICLSFVPAAGHDFLREVPPPSEKGNQPSPNPHHNKEHPSPYTLSSSHPHSSHKAKSSPEPVS